MDLTVERDVLAPVVAEAARIAPARETIPVLGCLRLAAEDGGGLRIAATDMDSRLEVSVAAGVREPGTALVPARALSAWLAKVPKGAQVKMTLEDGGGRLRVQAGRGRAVLPVLPAGDFPEWGVRANDCRGDVAADDLARLFGSVAWAASTEEVRYYLNGVFLHVVEDGDAGFRLRAVATDGHRLAIASVAAPEHLDADVVSVIVPRQAVAALRRLLAGPAEKGETVEVAWSAGAFEVSLPDGTLYRTKLIDGTFPDYERVVPSDPGPAVGLPRAALAAALARVTTISDDRARAVVFDLEPGVVKLEASGPESGSAEDVLDLEGSGVAVRVGFNGKYVLQVLDAFGGETVDARLGDGASPTQWTAPDGDGLTVVLMPMRV